MAKKMDDASLIYQTVLNPAALAEGAPFSQDDLHCFGFPGDRVPQPLRAEFVMHSLDTRTQRTSLDVPAGNYQFTQEA
jgi:hypothetical protein